MTNDEMMHSDHRKRMKQIFLENGLTAFSEIQKLEFLLFFAIPRKDVNPVAHNLINEFGSISKVMSASYDDLVKIDGVGPNAAMLIKTCKSFCDYSAPAEKITKLGSTTVAKHYCYNLMKNSDVEEFYVICLNERNQILKTKKIATGTIDHVRIEISDITKIAFAHKASKVILSHNHPSGNHNFSDEDIHMTHSVVCSCLLNNIRVVDHILVTPKTVKSLADLHIMDSIEQMAMNKLNIMPNAGGYASTAEEYVIENDA